MVNSRRSPLDETFFALSDPTRRAMLARLAEGEMSVGQLATPFGLSPAAVSKHIRVLKRAGLVKQRRVGLGRECSLDAAPLEEAAWTLERYRRFWKRQLDAFADYAEKRGRN